MKLKLFAPMILRLKEDENIVHTVWIPLDFDIEEMSDKNFPVEINLRNETREETYVYRMEIETDTLYSNVASRASLSRNLTAILAQADEGREYRYPVPTDVFADLYRNIRSKFSQTVNAINREKNIMAANARIIADGDLSVYSPEDVERGTDEAKRFMKKARMINGGLWYESVEPILELRKVGANWIIWPRNEHISSLKRAYFFRFEDFDHAVDMMNELHSRYGGTQSDVSLELTGNYRFSRNPYLENLKAMCSTILYDYDRLLGPTTSVTVRSLPLATLQNIVEMKKYHEKDVCDLTDEDGDEMAAAITEAVEYFNQYKHPFSNTTSKTIKDTAEFWNNRPMAIDKHVDYSFGGNKR